jgi:hypothetical protein
MAAMLSVTAPPAADFADPLTARIVGFVRSLGFTVEARTLEGETFLPGVAVVEGGLVIDPRRLAWPGDLLHEAGHLAVGDPARVGEGVSDEPGEEMAAIAWSYAAARVLDVDLEVLFHDGGYRGGGGALRDAFRQGGYVGVPLLAWWGMSIEPHRASPDGPPPYPHMLAWRRS